MRRGLILSLVILCVTMLGGTYAQRLTAGIAARYISAGHEMAVLAEKGDYAFALEVCRAYEDDWRRMARWLTMLVNHDDVDAVTLSLLEVRAGAMAKDAAMCFDASLRLTEAAEHLHHRDQFSLGNIL